VELLMPLDPRKQLIKTIKTRNFLNKDFDGFLADLNDYAKTYYGDKIKDLTPNGLGGLQLELAAFIGDVQSFYLDHQFHETSPETAVEPRNIERHLRDAGVPITGASPSVVDETFVIVVPADTSISPRIPLASALPLIVAGTTVISDGGVTFELTEDIDFSETNANGDLTAEIIVKDVDENNNPLNFIMSKNGICISGQRAIETFFVGNFEPYKRFTLSKENATEIIRVVDDLGNQYYEVEFLTEDTVFEAIPNRNDDNELVKDLLQIKPAPYRFYKRMDINTRLTNLVFGAGNAESSQDDIIPDPSDLALPLYGKRTFNRFTLNPGNLLQTATLGIIAPNTNLTIEYRYGGGLSHNAEQGTVRNLGNLNIDFPKNPTIANAFSVRQSLRVTNDKDASGGEDAPTLDDLKLLIPKYRNSQNRIVSNPDLLARLFNLPSNFGRVFRASVRPNPNNPNAAQLFIISRNINKTLTVSPDSLKKNLSTYLNKFRLISDAIDILDAKIVNLQLKYQIVVDPDYNKQLIIQNINSKLKSFFDIKNFQIDQPLNYSEIRNVIFNNVGVISVQQVQFFNITGTQGNTTYSNVKFDVLANTFKGLLIPPNGGIFEIKNLAQDIMGSSI
jgi:hypothetical protein